MATAMCCPFFVRESVNHKQEKVGIKCEGGDIKFPNKEARKNFVYPLCASLGGYRKCPIYQFLEDSCK